MSILFIILAAICNAVMDVLQFHFHTSVFKYMGKLWNPDISWKVAKMLPFTKYKLDAWHIFKSMMIVFLLFAMYGFSWWFVVGGIVWNLTFNLFYNKILR
jgi:hypothetical protein